MTDRSLSDLLERAADQTYVGPPPLDRMRADARGARHRRTTVMVATASAVAVIAAGTATLAAQRGGAPDVSTPVTSQSPQPTHPTHAASDTDLSGSWTVRALNGRSGRSVLADFWRGKVTLTFANGTVRGDTGCNAVSGTFLQGGTGGKDLRFPRRQLSSTLVGCTDEPPLLSRLSHVRHVSGSPGVRYLRSGIGMVIVELRRG